MCLRLARRTIPVLIAILAAPRALAHGDHSAQPPSVIDPLITHHAVLEDELKLNFASSRLGEDASQAHGASLEVAYAFSDLLGIEVFLPLGQTRLDGRTRSGLGDVRLQVPKVSFVRRYGWVMTAYAELTLPTGSQEAGLGGEGFGVAPHLLTDVGVGPFGVQANAALEMASTGEVASELNASVAHTLALPWAADAVLSPLLEFNAEVPLRGEERASLALTPGIKLGLDGWHLGAGVSLPVAGERHFDFQALLQVGYHVAWAQLMGRPKDAAEATSLRSR